MDYMPLINPAWQARWIWMENNTGPNTWLAFRHAFEWSDKSAPAVIKVACADKYWLWINGHTVIREGGLKSGPARTGWYFDELDVTGWLRQGRNQIAVLAWYWGRDGASHRNSGQGGLLLQLEGDGAAVCSGVDWKVCAQPAFGQRGDGLSVTLAEQAVDFDARLDMPGWTEAGFDDSGWSAAVVKGFPPVAPWGTPVLRPIPLWRDSEPRRYENDAEQALPILGAATVIERLPANLQVYPRFRVRATEAGREIVIRIERDKKTTRYLTRVGEQSFEVPTWGNGETVVYEVPDGVELLEVSYRETGYDADFAGGFSSSDGALDRLWAKAARTAYLCMRDTFMDCPDRERSPWIGDAANILEVSLRALDRRSDALIVKTLDELAGWAAPEGNLWSAVPTSRFAGSFREFPSQTLVMLGFGLPTYLNHTEDCALLARFYPAMKRYLMELFHVNEGIVGHRGPWAIEWGAGVQSWYDWSDNIDAELLDQVLYYSALGGMERSAALLGLADDVRQCEQVRTEIREAFDRAYWCDEVGAYRSRRHDGPPDERGQALAILSALAPDARYPALADCIEATERCSIYMERYPLVALVKAGRPQSALKRLHGRFAGEIASEYSTLPEFFGKPSNHAWGGAAIVLLAEALLGITQIEPGFRRIGFAPPEGGLESAEQTITTVHGMLRLAFRRANGGIDYELTVPAGVIVEVMGTAPVGEGVWRVRVEYCRAGRREST
jgi:alpha-L-rhamnosidase